MSEKTHAEIIAEMRYKMGVTCPWQVNGGTCELCPLGHSPHGKDLGKYCSFHKLANELEAAHKREVDVLKQRCAELNAEVVAKDEVIKRLNDAISEEQRRKMATAENPLTVGDCAKLREALCEILSYIESFHKYITPGKGKKLTALFAVADTIRGKTKAALAAPPRNCDRFGSSTQARAEWYKTEVLPRVEGVVSGVEPPFVDWLFAPATEKEGGNK